MSGPLKSVSLQGATLEWFPKEPDTDDASHMYVLDALGVRIRVRHRWQDEGRMDTYISIEEAGGCVVEVNESGGVEYS